LKRIAWVSKGLPLLVLFALLMGAGAPASALLFFQDEPDVTEVFASAKNGMAGEVLSFSAEDFTVTGAGELAVLRIQSLPDPAVGVLTIGGQTLSVGDEVYLRAVEGLRFVPALAPQSTETSVVFTPVFADGSEGTAVESRIYLLSEENRAPIAENMELSTYQNVAVTERFGATDPEGDLLTFQLVKKPARGAVTMPEDGSNTFVYTPYENKKGKDSFTYIAIDSVGNQSKPATVTIQIEKAQTTVKYSDMEGNPAHNAAIRLAEEGIYVGECIGETYFFQPDTVLTRDQFLAFAMAALEKAPLEGITVTGFADDNSIPVWAKGYVTAALKDGLIQGGRNESGQVTFGAGEQITRAEATVLLNRMLRVADVTAGTYADSDTAPAWAYQSAVNLETCGVLRTDDSGALALEQQVTRGDAAQMLAGALDLLEARKANTWFHW